MFYEFYDLNKRFDEFLNKNYKRNHQESQQESFNDFCSEWSEKLFGDYNKQEKIDSDLRIVISGDESEMSIALKAPGFDKEDFDIFIEGNYLKIETDKDIIYTPFENDKVIQDFKIEKISKKIKLQEKFVKGDVKAYLENGILKIYIKKSKEFTKNIQIV